MKRLWFSLSTLLLLFTQNSIHADTSREQDKFNQEWIEKLKEGTNEEKKTAAIILGGRKVKCSVDPMIKTLGNSREDLEVRVEMLKGLVRTEDRKAIRRVLWTLNSSNNKMLRVAAAQNLGKTGNSLYLKPLLKALSRDRDVLVKVAVIKALPNFDDTRANDTLIELLSPSTSDQLQNAAIQSLTTLKIQESARPLMDLYHQTDSVKKKVSILRSIGKIGNRQMASDLIAIAEGSDSTILRARAIEAIGNFKKTANAPIIRSYLNERSTPIQYYTVIALTQMDDKDSIHTLKKIYENYIADYIAYDMTDHSQKNLKLIGQNLKLIGQNLKVREKILEALVQLGPEKSTVIFRNALKKPRYPTEAKEQKQLSQLIDKIIIHAIEGIRKANDITSSSYIVEEVLLQDPDLSLRRHAIETLTALNTKPQYDRLIQQIGYGATDEERANAAYALGGFHDEVLVEPLTLALKDRSDRVVKEALLAIAETPGATDPLTIQAVIDTTTNKELKEISKAVLKTLNHPYRIFNGINLQIHYGGRASDGKSKVSIPSKEYSNQRSKITNVYDNDRA